MEGPTMSNINVRAYNNNHFWCKIALAGLCALLGGFVWLAWRNAQPFTCDKVTHYENGDVICEKVINYKD